MRFLLCNHSGGRTWDELPGGLHQKPRIRTTRRIRTDFVGAVWHTPPPMIIHNLRIMKKKMFILAGCLSVVFIIASAQCPERDVLTNRVIYLRDSSRIPSKDQLPELLS